MPHNVWGGRDYLPFEKDERRREEIRNPSQSPSTRPNETQANTSHPTNTVRPRSLNKREEKKSFSQ